MTKDKALEELFQTQKPHFDDKAAFMAKLNQRLDAVEYIKQYQDATIRRYKMAMIVAFVVGIISGGVATIFLLSMPDNHPYNNLHNKIRQVQKRRRWVAHSRRSGSLSCRCQ